ncbi:hypothetical protein ABVK25_010144 [Lepraria finkii]|uniref:Uncharacterized protein n=1 Tax=Lepraria finkii TaxID=1340010 RepID=A0ABR4AV57_9LECA
MEPASEPSPPSLGPPHRALLPRQAASPATTSTATSIPAPAMANSIELTARYTMPSIPRPPIVEHLTVLNDFLRVRPRHSEQPKVIAIDGSDRKAVQMLIANLQNHITRNLKCTVRVMDDDFARRPMDPSTQLHNYSRQLHDWSMMWKKIAEAPPPGPPPTRAVQWITGAGWPVTGLGILDLT